MRKELRSSRGSPLKSLGTIVGHPLRAKIWTVLAEEVASPTGLSRRFGEEIADVSYHVRVLRENDVIELVNKRQVRGAVEHFYRATQRPLSDEADTASRSLECRNGFADHVLRTFFADAVLSLGDGIFGERPDHCVARVPLLADEEGWRKLALMYDEVIHRTFEIQAESAERLAPGDPGIKVTAFASLFERTFPSRDPLGQSGTKATRLTYRRVGGERGPLKSLGAIVGHPLRAEIWTVLAEEIASPNQLSGRLGQELADVAYHVKVLRNRDVIELVNTQQVRGAVEHFYRAIQRPLSDEADTAARSVENRNAFADHILKTFFADAVLSLGDGIFGERPDHCVARVPLLADEEGWRDLALMYDELVHRTLEVQAEIAERLAPGEPGVRITAFAALFERTSPSGDSPQQPGTTKGAKPTSRRGAGERG